MSRTFRKFKEYNEQSKFEQNDKVKKLKNRFLRRQKRSHPRDFDE